MSIVTLKKKVSAQYDNMSVNRKGGFSINGCTRSQGFVGQTMLSRSLPRTLMKGNVPKGHGGCCGTFPINPIIQSGVNYLNDPKIVKPSVINTKEMIEMKYYCVPPRNCKVFNQLNNTVKSDTNNNLNTQQQYIENLSKKEKNIICANQLSGNMKRVIPDVKHCNDKPCYISMDPKKESKVKQLSQSEYLTNRLSALCVKNDNQYIKSSMKRSPFACGIK